MNEMRKIITIAILALSINAFAQNEEGIVSDFHKTHFGQILFCKTSSPDLTGIPEFVTSFNSKDDISGCVYLKPNGADGLKYDGRITIIENDFKYTIQGETYNNIAAFIIKILSSGSVVSNDFSNYVVLHLEDGTYKIRIELWDREDDKSVKDIIAIGEFTLNKGGAPSEKFGSIQAGMVDATLEQQALKVINAKAASENWTEKYTKAKIVSTAWEVEKNEITGAIICRKIYMKLLGVWPDGKCQAVDMGFRQDYIGGKYSSTLQYHSIGDMKLILCD